MLSFNVLDSTQQIVGPHFLEASAGTGKTFAIEHIVVRLLLESKLDIKCHEILVVTFTRAATRELKQRIRYNLQKTLASLENKTTEVSYLKSTITKEELRDAGIKKLQEALSSFDQVQIFTIHGFCHQMLTTYAFDAGLGLQDSISDTLSYQEIQRQRIFDFLRSELKVQGFHRHQIHKVLKKAHYDLSQLARKILAIINKNVVLPKFLSEGELLEEFTKIVIRYQVDGTTCVEQFVSIAPLFRELTSKNKEPHAHFLKQAMILAKCLENHQHIEACFDELLSYDEFFLEHLVESALKKNVKKSFALIEQESVFFKLSKELYPLLAEAKDETKIVLRLAYYCQERMNQAYSYHGVTPPDDLLKLMYQSLKHEVFCKRVQERYKAAIIDEFQDTDPLQWEIVSSLFLINRDSFPLYLVGDPKQSIYAFRNADLSTYLKAAKQFSIDQKYSLNVNYRSEPGLIAALNALFLLSDKWLSDDGTLSYVEVRANPGAQDTLFDDGYGPVHFFIAQQESIREKQVPSKHAEECFLFPFIAQEIVKLSQQGMSYNAFAILIRDRFQGERLEAYLKKVKIPYVATSVVNLVDTLAFNFLNTLLNMLDSIEEMSAIKLLLSHSFMGFSHEELKVNVKNDKTLQAICKLKTLSVLYFEQGFLRFWDAFLQTSFHTGEPSFEELLVSQDIQHYQDLNQLVELLAEEHKHGQLSHEELSYALLRLEEKDPEVNEQIKRRVAFEEEGVTIMTMHKSKGLEFDIVFALGLSVRSSFKEETIKCKEELVILDEISPVHQEIVKQTEKEKLRQLYVALTRAKKRVYVPLCLSLDVEAKSLLSPIELFLQTLCSSAEIECCSKQGILSLLKSLESNGVSYTDLNVEIPSVTIPKRADNIVLYQPHIYTKKFEGWYTSSYSKMAQEVHIVQPSLKLEEMPLLTASAETGHVLHKILEKIFERGLYIDEKQEGIYPLILQEIALSHLAGFEKEIKKIVDDVMCIQFQTHDALFSFKDIEPSNLVTEMEFLLEEHVSQGFKGFIDLIVQYQGKYYLIDWKSNFLGIKKESYSREALKECMEHYSYFIQAELYGRAVKMYLQYLGKDEGAYGGIFYVFLRGLDRAQGGIYYVS